MSSKLGTEAKALLRYSFPCDEMDCMTVELLTESGITDFPKALISSKLGMLNAYAVCRVAKTKNSFVEFGNITLFLF